MTDILAEYRNYAYPKARPLDEEFIMAFDHTKIDHLAKVVDAANWNSPTLTTITTTSTTADTSTLNRSEDESSQIDGTRSDKQCNHHCPSPTSEAMVSAMM